MEFDPTSYFCLKAETKPPKDMSREELRYTISTMPFNCRLCGQRVNKTYHIHQAIRTSKAQRYKR